MKAHEPPPPRLSTSKWVTDRTTSGTAGDGHDSTRGYMALDWLIRTWLPTWLDLVPACHPDATQLRELGRIGDLVSAQSAGPVVRASRENAAAAWDAARDAARAQLEPTVAALQQSAIELYTRMVTVQGAVS